MRKFFQHSGYGYHVYRDLWAASIGELLPCEREVGNASDRYAEFSSCGPCTQDICSIFCIEGELLTVILMDSGGIPGI